MRNRKPWYEKVNIWIGIVSGICTILGVSVFGGKYIFENDSKQERTESTQTPQLISASTQQPSEEPASTPESIPEQISIRNISEFYSDGIEHRNFTITDNIGESYEGFTFMGAGDFWVEPEGSVVYRNDNQYNRFWGRVIISQNEKNDRDCGWIKIYGDDNLLLDTGTMGRGIEPIDFDFDISMYSEIKIDFKDGEWSNDSIQYPKCYLVNTYFEVK